MTKAEQKAARTALMESIYAGSVGTSVERSLPRAKFIGPGAEAIYAARVARCNEVEAEMRAEGFFDLVAS